MKTLLLILAAISLVVACSDESLNPTSDCIQAANEAGAPSLIISYMEQSPDEWGSLERLAIRDALEEYDLSGICPEMALAIAPPPENATSSLAAYPTAEPPSGGDAKHEENATSSLAAYPTEPTPTATTGNSIPPQIPFPIPTTQPISPPVNPSPTSIHDEITEAAKESLGRVLGTPEVVKVTHYGYATNNRGGGRYIVVFDEPVFTEVPPGTRNTSVTSSSGLKLHVEYPGSGDVRYLRLVTPATIDNPQLTLEFGPVREEFAIARELSLNDGAAIRGLNGQDAQVDFPYPVVFVNAGYGDDLADSRLVNCLAFLELYGVSPLIRRNLRELRVEEMTDADRIEWGEVLRDEIDSDWRDLLRLPCSALWTEEITTENVSKRNREWDCEIDDDFLLGEAVLNQPYDSLNMTERLMLQFIVDYQGDSRECRQYYPQLYYDLWIPMTQE